MPSVSMPCPGYMRGAVLDQVPGQFRLQPALNRGFELLDEAVLAIKLKPAGIYLFTTLQFPPT
ncbi:hypothetical protein SAMN05444745_101523 [Arthrobacter sp. OV608]|nr:hypothetical protein SAMN05444745_101523 [Arthrobacter sp. OV608]